MTVSFNEKPSECGKVVSRLLTEQHRLLVSYELLFAEVN